MTRHRSLVEPEDQDRFLGGHFLHFFFFFLFRLVMQNNFNSLTFYIEFSSKFLGVGLNLALLKDI